MTGKLYYVSKTLIGGGDINRRTVIEADAGADGKPVFSTEKIVCIINPHMADWTYDHMRWQDTILAALRERAKQDATPA